MERDATRLRRMLLDAGLSRPVVDAAWPGGWHDEAARAEPDRAELRRALSRRLGISTDSLSGNRVEFVWRDEARFKNLAAPDAEALAALTSFAMSVGRLVLAAVPAPPRLPPITAQALRRALMQAGPWVDLSGLLAVAWDMGIPVVHLRVFPLTAKRMQAVAAGIDGRFAILLARDAQYAAPLAFTLAHELGHGFLGHLGDGGVLVDFESDAPIDDPDERAADAFALECLTGDAAPQIIPGAGRFSGAQLARAAMEHGRALGIEPGSLALVTGYQHDAWSAANMALSFIYDAPRPLWQDINQLAAQRMDWSALGDDSAYIATLLGLPTQGLH